MSDLVRNPEDRFSRGAAHIIFVSESFCREAGRSSSFGEMLFLVAIHFHGNHMHAIAELVCSTLGMKVCC